MKTKLLSLFALLALTGCATPPPEQVSITSGIFQSPIKKSLKNVVSGGPEKKLLIFLSSNTKANIAFLKSEQDSRKKELFGNDPVVQAHIAAMDPQFPTAWIINSLKKKFGTIRLVKPESISNERDFDTVVIVDFLFQTTDWGINHATASVTTSFYDKDFAHIVDASAYKKVRVRDGGPTMDEDLFQKNHQVLVSTLQEWDSALGRVVEIPAAANRPSSPQAYDQDSCVRSALQVKDGTLRQSAIVACTP